MRTFGPPGFDLLGFAASTNAAGCEACGRKGEAALCRWRSTCCIVRQAEIGETEQPGDI
jgi:hypothetical protein